MPRKLAVRARARAGAGDAGGGGRGRSRAAFFPAIELYTYLRRGVLAARGDFMDLIARRSAG